MIPKLTIFDIAKLAGVGKSTVSRVLTGDPKVKPATREKVELLIKSSGYVPSKFAQGMRGGAGKVIGVIVTRLDSPSENKAVSGILNVIYSAGYDAVIMESQFCPKKTNEHLNVLKKRNMDGLIVFGFSGCDFAEIEKLAYKTVVIAADIETISSVDYDHKGLINLAMDRLVKEGKHQISFIGVDDKDMTTGLMRLDAYKAHCVKRGFKPCYQTGQLCYDSAYQITDQVIHAQTDAIVCASDTLAMGVAKRLQELQRTDIQVSGVGATDLLSFLFPNTFSIDPGYYQAGMVSVNLLLKQLAGQRSVTHLIQPALW